MHTFTLNHITDLARAQNAINEPYEAHRAQRKALLLEHFMEAASECDVLAPVNGWALYEAMGRSIQPVQKRLMQFLVDAAVGVPVGKDQALSILLAMGESFAEGECDE